MNAQIDIDCICPPCALNYEDVRRWMAFDSPGALARAALEKMCDLHRAQLFERYVLWRCALDFDLDARGAVILDRLFREWLRVDIPDVAPALKVPIPR